MVLCCRYKRNRKQSFNPERGSDAPDGKRSMSQDNTSWDAGSKSELVTSAVERSPSADGDVVVCPPPLPKRESRGELVLPTLSLDPTSGQSTGQWLVVESCTCVSLNQVVRLYVVCLAGWDKGVLICICMYICMYVRMLCLYFLYVCTHMCTYVVKMHQ